MKKSAVFSILVLILSTGFSPSVIANENEVVNENEITLDAESLDVAMVALVDFKRKRKDWRCFEVTIYRDAKQWQVEFSPMDNVRDVGDKILVGVTRCGNGISYTVSKNKKITGVSYSK